MNPYQKLQSSISTMTTLMWVFRGLGIVPTLVFLAGLNAGSTALTVVGLVFAAPLMAVHFTLWFKINSKKDQLRRMWVPTPPRPYYGPPTQPMPYAQRPPMPMSQGIPQYHPHGNFQRRPY